MCAILAWSGKLPIGLLSGLLTNMQVRGRDGTGIAFRDSASEKPQTVSYRQAYSAQAFVKMHQNELRRARHSRIGLGHARRASTGMIIDPHNAHPFVCGKTFFIHNGFVRNWKQIDSTVTNDSMVLGPTLEEYSKNAPESIAPNQTLNMSKFHGIMAVAWMRRDTLRCFKINQDLVSAEIVWNDAGVEQKLCIVCSTREIIEESLKKIQLDCECRFTEIDEGRVYRITDAGIVEEATMTVDSTCYVDDSEGKQTKLRI